MTKFKRGDFAFVRLTGEPIIIIVAQDAIGDGVPSYTARTKMHKLENFNEFELCTKEELPNAIPGSTP